MTEKEKFEEIEIVDWVLGVWEDDRDLIAWEDIDVRKLKGLGKQDKIRKTTDQSYGQYTHACTMMSTYWGILSIFNMDTQEAEKEEIIKEALDNGYKIKQGRWTRLGVKYACKVWNRLHPNKKVIYLKTYIGSEQWKIALEKWFPIITSYKTSSWYTRDKRDNGVVDWKDFNNFNGGHAIAAYWSEDSSVAWEHVNTYPKNKYNDYKVRYGYDLVKNGVYYPWCYIIIPEDEWNLEEAKKRKMVKIYMKLGQWIYDRALSENTKKHIKATNDYFRSVGFNPDEE